jgi:hypothetical protein
VTEVAYVCELVAQVIKVKNIDVGLAAIDAWMRLQIFAYPSAEFPGPMIPTNPGTRDLFLPVSRIPRVCVRALAKKANPLACLTPERSEGELYQGLYLLADTTDTDTESRIDQ